MESGKRGFTLIELLVVIAIIAILAAILFPVFVNAKARAYQAQCLANLRQIGSATALYMSDSGGRFAPWLAYNPKTGLWEGAWYYLMQKYSKTKLLANCPKMATQGYLVSYEANGYTNYWVPEQPKYPPIVDTQVKYSKTTVYLMDCAPSDASVGGTVAQHCWWGPPHTFHGWDNVRLNGKTYAQLSLEAERRHSGGANVLFCDWHVRCCKPEEFQTTIKGTSLSCPLRKLPRTPGAGQYVPDPPYGERNDGIHPWFRPD